METSPFVFQHPLAPDRLHGRDREVEQLAASAAAGNATILAAPRRYGKTSVLLAVEHRLAEAGHPVALVDLYATASLAELTVRLERAWTGARSRWIDKVEQWLSAANLGLSVKGAGFGMYLSRRPRTDPTAALHRLLELPVHLAGERRAIVIFDEFQALGGLRGAEGLLRAHIQRQRDVAGYLFAGSEPHLLERQFNDPDRPFYGQALHERLGRPARTSLHDVITGEFERTERQPGDALGPLLDLSEAHPQRTMLLAHFLWQATPAGAVATLAHWQEALDVTRRHVSGEAQAVYDRATLNQQRVLRALAHDQSPFTLDARSTLGLPTGSVNKTIDSAVRDGLLEPTGEQTATAMRIVDPMLRDWIRSRLP